METCKNMWQLHTTLESIGATWCKSTETTKHGKAEHSMDMKLSCCGQRDELDNKHGRFKIWEGKNNTCAKIDWWIWGSTFLKVSFLPAIRTVVMRCFRFFLQFWNRWGLMRAIPLPHPGQQRQLLWWKVPYHPQASAASRYLSFLWEKTQATKNGKSWWS